MYTGELGGLLFVCYMYSVFNNRHLDGKYWRDAVSIYAVCDARLKVRFRVGYVGVGCQSFSLRWMMS